MPRRTTEPFSLRHRKYFPIFSELPEDYDIGRADWHYCLLVEIVEIIPYFRPMFKVKDKENKEFVVIFYFDDGTKHPEEWKKNCKPGGVMAIKDALSHAFMDGQIGIRAEEVDDIKMIPCNLNTLLLISDEVTKSSSPNIAMKCNMCKKPAELKCSRCFVRYCDKACQTLDWKASHRHECLALQLVSDWRKRDWDNGDRYWAF